LLGIWKSYDELEANLSLPELFATLDAKREDQYSRNRFLAALQGVDLEEDEKEDAMKRWEDIKTQVATGGLTSDSDDILALSGSAARDAGFGIGLGLSYANSDDSEWWLNG
jgi:hypothetical protein